MAKTGAIVRSINNVFKKIYLDTVFGKHACGNVREKTGLVSAVIRDGNAFFFVYCVANGGMRKADFRPFSRSFLLALVFFVYHYLNDGACVSPLANAFGPGSDMEKYTFAAFVVPKSLLEPLFCTLLKASRNI